MLILIISNVSSRSNYRLHLNKRFCTRASMFGLESVINGLNLSSMVDMTLYAADAGTVKPYLS